MVLLIGATGFLGPPVIKKLLKSSYEVNCLVRISSDRSDLLDVSKSAGKKITFSTGTLQSEDSIISIIKKADSIIYLPMLGKKESLNVAVAFGVAGYQINSRKRDKK